MPSKTSLKDKLDGDHLDLSLSQLTEIPVEEMKCLPRGSNVDLSNNYLTYLPDTFPSLTHIVKLDLSKNMIDELPEYFGNLKNLKHLDLYSNKIERLPVSFSNLKSLKWLDLKNNPLVPALQSAAGPCITANDCAMCAKKVVALMQSAQSQLELERNRKYQEDILARERKAKEELEERERIRAEKRAAKERRRDEARARRESEAIVNSPQHEMEQPRPSSNGTTNGKATNSKYKSKEPPTNKGRGCCSTLLALMFGLIMLSFSLGASLLWIYTGGQLDQHSIEQAIPVIQHDFDIYTAVVGTWSEKQLNRMGTSKDGLNKKAHELWVELKRRNDLVAYYLNENLGPYFCNLTNYFKQWRPQIAKVGQAVEKWTYACCAHLTKVYSDVYRWVEQTLKSVMEV